MNETAKSLASIEMLDGILHKGQLLGSAALETGVNPDVNFGVKKIPGWLVLQRPSLVLDKPWVRQVVLTQTGGIETVHGMDCASDDVEAIVAAGAQGYYRHRELSQRSYFEAINNRLPLVTYLLGDITLHDIDASLDNFAAREKLTT